MTAHGALVDAIRSTFPNLEARLLATAVTLVLVAVVEEVVRRFGPYLKERASDPLVESAQAALVTLVVLAVGAFLVVVWGVTEQVVVIFRLFGITRTSLAQFVLSIAVVVAAYSATRGIKRAIEGLSQSRSAISQHHREIAHHVSQIAIFVFAAFFVLGMWGVKLSGLLVGAGVVTVVLGLAARQTLGALLAGFVVLLSRPFEMGDWIQISDREGVVTDITIFHTQIRTFDDEVVMIPNDQVTSSEIVNRSRKGRLRLETDVGIDYANDLDRAEEIATDVLDDVDLVEAKPDPHVVYVEFSESSVVARLRYYIDNPSSRKMWKTRTQVITNVRERFAEEGIKIPSPRRELSARTEEGGFHVASGEPAEIEKVAPVDERPETAGEGVADVTGELDSSPDETADGDAPESENTNEADE